MASGAGTSDAGPQSPWQAGYRALVAWVVLILFILVLTRSRFGYVLVYYALLLMIFFLIVTQARFFVDALRPFGDLGPGLSGGGGSSGPAQGDG